MRPATNPNSPASSGTVSRSGVRVASGGDVGGLSSSCGSGEGTLATDAAAFTLAHPAPDAELLAVLEGVLEAVLTHDTASAHFLGFAGARTTLGEEEVGVDAQAVGVVLPGPFLGFGFVIQRHEFLRQRMARTGSPPAAMRVITAL